MPSHKYSAPISDTDLHASVLTALVRCVLDGVYPEQNALRARGARGGGKRVYQARDSILARGEVVLPPELETRRQKEHQPAGRRPMRTSRIVVSDLPGTSSLPTLHPPRTHGAVMPAKITLPRRERYDRGPLWELIGQYWSAWWRLVPRPPKRAGLGVPPVPSLIPPVPATQDGQDGPQPLAGAMDGLQAE
jgi:hypothetical protein